MLTNYGKRLLIAIVVIISAIPLALILAFVAAQGMIAIVPASSEVPVLAILVIVFATAWVGFMFLLSIAGAFMPFLITLSIPLAYVLAGFGLSKSQGILALIFGIAFVILAQLIHRTITPLLAIGAVGLAYGLYLFPPFQSLFTSRSTATISWLISLLLCWIILSVPLGLIENAIIARKKQSEPAVLMSDPVNNQIRNRLRRMAHMGSPGETPSK
jgi:hypothetical protein